MTFRDKKIRILRDFVVNPFEKPHAKQTQSLVKLLHVGNAVKGYFCADISRLGFGYYT